MSTIKATTLSTQSNATVPIDTVVNGTAKAWVNFNGTSTVAIRASFNVASITDIGTGQYRVNFTTAMTDSSYSAVSMSADASAGTICFIDENVAVPTASGINIRTTGNAATASADTAFICVSIFR
jgi:hypothetical protein